MRDFGPLKKEPGVPLYLSLAALIKEAIAGEALKDGERLPTEKEFTDCYKVSRATVRAALNRLAQDGLLEPRQGSGVYVCQKPRCHLSFDLGSFTSSMKNGQQARTLVLLKELVSCEGRQVLHLKRVRGVDEGGKSVRWLTLEESYVEAEGLEGLVDHDFAKESLYAVLRQKYGINPHHGYFEIGAVTAPKEAVEYLKCKKSDPLVEVLQEVFAKDGKLVERVKIIYAARTTFRVFSNIGH